MKQLTKNCVVILLMIITTIAFCIFMIDVLKSKYKMPDGYVSGNQHIYKGQRLCSDWSVKLESLSTRAKWLKTTQHVDVRMKPSLEQMIVDAEAEGMCIVVVSAYRTPEKQQILYNSIQDKTMVALPHESEHQTGLAVDLTACPMVDGVRNDNAGRLDLEKPFKDLPEYCWMIRNAWKYGFEQSFTEYNKNITGYSAEPWHWKFIIN